MAAVDPRLSGLRVVPCSTLYDALREALGPAVDKAPASGRGKSRRRVGSEEEEGGGGGWDGGGPDDDDDVGRGDRQWRLGNDDGGF